MNNNYNIKVYNSLTNKIEDFKTIKEGEVSMYVCGPTVYDHQHIGNARPVVFFDTVKRFLKYIGYNVKHVSNFTDIDDKIILSAQKEGVKEEEISSRYMQAFIDANVALNCEMDVIRPQVTKTIPEIVSFINDLVKTNHAYVSGDDVYFRVQSDDKYGCLSNQKLDELEVGARIDINSGKEDPRDFTLWKKTSDTGRKWDSCFGAGRPGWHTECVVMIHKILGDQIDIHGGGIDLKFPHHENEIAQNYSLCKNTLANYWIHNARLDLKGEKMSKSLGNVIWIKDIVKEYHPMALRLCLLSNHYRQTIQYQSDMIKQMEQEYYKIEKLFISLYRKLELSYNLKEGNVLPIMNEFLNEMAYDFNTANAIAKLYDLMKIINTHLRDKNITISSLQDDYKTLKDMLYVLGINVDIKPLNSDELKLVNDWLDARNNKDFDKADILRNKITELGIRL